ncbi:MAG: MBOAT family O-acyltransferase [Erysipelothrix sp.]
MSYTSSIFFLSLILGVIVYWYLPKKLQKYLIFIMNTLFLLSYSANSLIWILGISLLAFFTALSGKKTIKIVTTVLFVGSFFYLKFTNYFIAGLNNYLNLSIDLIKILMPIGLSFYMIQNLMYFWKASDTYPPEKNIIKYLSYSMFFPTVVQGPIAKYEDVSDQIWSDHDFNNDMFSRGFKLIILGLFKKLIIAGRAAMISNAVFNATEPLSGVLVIVGAIAYTVELYMDFSAAVDICRGVSYLLGIELPVNFDTPYFALTIKDFWRRWHITLSTFLTEFIYFPLGGSRCKPARRYLNILIVFLVSGIWHGVGLSYIAWGMLHAFYQIFGSITLQKRTDIKNQIQGDNLIKKRVITFLSWIVNLSLISLAWILFRANSLKSGLSMILSIFSRNPIVINTTTLGISKMNLLILFVACCIVFFLEYKKAPLVSQYVLSNESNNSILLYLAIIFIFIFGIYGSGYDSSSFIYMGF